MRKKAKKVVEKFVVLSFIKDILLDIYRYIFTNIFDVHVVLSFDDTYVPQLDNPTSCSRESNETLNTGLFPNHILYRISRIFNYFFLEKNERVEWHAGRNAKRWDKAFCQLVERLFL